MITFYFLFGHILYELLESHRLEKTKSVLPYFSCSILTSIRKIVYVVHVNK